VLRIWFFSDNSRAWEDASWVLGVYFGSHHGSEHWSFCVGFDFDLVFIATIPMGLHSLHRFLLYFVLYTFPFL